MSIPYLQAESRAQVSESLALGARASEGAAHCSHCFHLEFILIHLQAQARDMPPSKDQSVSVQQLHEARSENEVSGPRPDTVKQLSAETIDFGHVSSDHLFRGVPNKTL